MKKKTKSQAAQLKVVRTVVRNIDRQQVDKVNGGNWPGCCMLVGKSSAARPEVN